MLPKINLLESVFTAAAIAFVFSKDEDVKGYASRTLSYYSIAPIVDIDTDELIRDFIYFLNLTEETRLVDIDDDYSVTLTGAEAFNDLLNEVALNFPFEVIPLNERIAGAHGWDSDELKSFVRSSSPRGLL